MIFRVIYPMQTGMPGQAPDQRETTSRGRGDANDTSTKKSIRPLFYIMFGIVALLLLWLWVVSKTPPSPVAPVIDERTRPSSESNGAFKDNQPGSEAYSINWEKANQFYLSGYREYSAENYLRALDDFRASLELYPDHRLAKIYIKKTDEAITQVTEQNYKSAINYFNGGQYALAIYYFQSVMNLLKHRKPPEGFCQARLERTAPIDNPDFEKYCDSEQKISDAQSKMSGGSNF